MHSDGEQQQLRKWEYYEWSHFTAEQKIDALFESVNELVDVVNSVTKQLEASHSHLIEELSKVESERMDGTSFYDNVMNEGTRYDGYKMAMNDIKSLLKRKGETE